MQLENTRIIVTGAASGIGAALLAQLATYKTHIIAVDIDPSRLEATCAALQNPSATVEPYVGDMMKAEAIDALFDHAQTCDIFIANAGFAYYGELGDPNFEQIERIFQLNTFSPIYAAQKMAQRNAGKPYKVVITASAMAHWALPGYALYSGTKAALHAFAVAYRDELDDPSQLMLVYPIATRTNFFEQDDKQDAPLPSPSQTPEEVAAAIVQGILSDQQAVYPSRVFRIVKFLNRFLPMQRISYNAEAQRLREWLAR